MEVINVLTFEQHHDSKTRLRLGK